MSTNRYATIKDLFNRAAELATAERPKFLQAECDDSGIRREVEKMLTFAGDDDEDSFERGAFHVLDKIPERVGSYRVLREIGRGGMGVVYEAVRETDNFSQRVALKVIKRGMDTDAILSRFRVEQKILASLEHPFIARFLDGGMTDDGLAFYAMEFVEGEPIDSFCASRKCDPRAIATLFREVCSAVQYAHQNLVIHRDLKPKNILVTDDGKPKLLDFGIGKLLTPGADEDPGTATQLGMMTPAYASPEQIRGERIGTTSDVYSLGVILYELLTGRGPYEFESRTRNAVERAILESEPLRPSTAIRRHAEKQPPNEIRNPKSLSGDLENILLKALSKEVADRYVSVGQFSEDLRRHLEGLPVIARPLTFRYRAAKFVGRNRVGVATAALVFLTLLGGIATTGWQSYRAEKQRKLAEKRFAEVRNLANNVVFKYHDEIEKLSGSTAVREMLVKDATVYLDNLAADAENDPVLEHELALAYLKLGDVQGKIYAANTGNSAGALESYRKSLRLLEKVAVELPNDVAVKDDLIRANDAMVFLMARTGGTSDEKIAQLNRSAQVIDDILKIEPRNAKRLLQLVTLYVRYGDSIGQITNRESLRQKLDFHLKALGFSRELEQLAPDDNDTLRAVMKINQRLGTDHIWLGENAERNGLSAEAAESFGNALPFHRRMVELIDLLAAKLPEDASVRRNRFAAMLSYAETLARNSRGDEARIMSDNALKMALDVQALDPSNREAPLDVADAYTVIARIASHRDDKRRRVDALKNAIAIYEDINGKDATNFEVEKRLLETLRQAAAELLTIGDDKTAAEYQRRVAELMEIAKRRAG